MAVLSNLVLIAVVIYKPANFAVTVVNILRILHECSCFIEFIKRVGGKEIKCKACRAFYRFFASS